MLFRSKYIASAAANIIQFATGAYLFRQAASGSAGSTASLLTTMTLDASGNLGLSVTPSAWSGSFKAIDLQGGSVASAGTSELRLYTNAYYNGTSTLYRNTAAATLYQGNGGQHLWYTAPSGTAGNAITFTNVMTLTSASLSLTGNLLAGTDATYDIGASGATRFRDFYLSRNATIGGTLGVTGATTIGTAQIGRAHV